MIPAPPRCPEFPPDERISDFLAEPAVKRRFATAAKQALADSNRRLQTSRRPEELEREAQWLEDNFYARLSEAVNANTVSEIRGFKIGRMDMPANPRLTPFDAMLSMTRRVAGTEHVGSLDHVLDWHYAPDGDAFRPAEAEWKPASAELQQAAALRREAFLAEGDRDYPALTCPHCLRLTGWLATSGNCDYCDYAVKAISLIRGHNRNAWWREKPVFLSVGLRYDQAVAHEYRNVRRGPGQPSFLYALRKGEEHERARLLAWGKETLELLNDCAPAAPQEGYELWLAERFELEAVDGSDVLVHFRATRHRWAEGKFHRLVSTLPQAQIANPQAFSATLEPQALASAWYDFKLAVAYVNQGEYQAALVRSASKHDSAELERQRRETLNERRGAAQILQV
jgi:hypothetical protein